MKKSIKEIWQQALDDSTEGKAYPIFIGSEASKPVARIANGGTEVLPLPSIYVRIEGSFEGKLKNESYRGFSVQLETGAFSSSDAGQRYAIISCADISYADIFLIFSERLIEKLEEGITPSKAVQQMINDWLGFFKKSGLQPLDLEQITGLFGELIFLKQLVEKFGSNKKVLGAWHGPKGANWDFSLGDILGSKILVEIKTTIRPRTVITISNMDQLCPIVGGDAWLNFISVEYLENSSAKMDSTIVELIVGLRASFGSSQDGNIASEFDELLEMIGYFPIHDDTYKKHSFRINLVRWYEITNEFPALSRQRLPPDVRERIDKLTYRLNIGGLHESEPPVQLTK